MKELEIKLIKYDMYFLCFTCFTLFVGLALLFADNQKQDNRLNEQKKVIELMNEANKSQQESIKLLMKNQILLNNKLKRYERNK